MQDETTLADSGDGKPAKPFVSSSAKWGPFELRGKLGEGGFGEVYRAYDPLLQREVALKLLHLRGDDLESEARAVIQEARLIAKVRHPNVVSVYGVDTFSGRIGFWSDFVDGQTLTAILAAQGTMGAREAAGIIVDVAKAVSAVHAAGLLHRDIKASNVMREVGGKILLLDFGLTHDIGATVPSGGTPAYMAPELMLHQEPSRASDIYALGVLLFHLLTLKYPFQRSLIGLPSKRLRLLDERPDLPEPLSRVIEKATELDPSHRYQTAGELIAALSGAVDLTEATRTSPQVPTKRKWLFAAAAAFAVTVGGAAIYFRPGGLSPVGGAHATYNQAQELLDHYYRPKAIEEAIRLFEKTTAEDPKFALAYAGLARAHFLQYWQLRDKSHVEPSEAAATKALSLDRNLPSAHVTLGRLYTETGRNDLATQEIDEALRLDSRSAEAHQALAELYLRQGRTADVEPELRKATDLAPEDWRFQSELGYFYLRTGQMENAIAAYKAAEKLSPDNARVITNLGVALRRSGKTTEAIEAARKAIAIEPGFNRYSNLSAALEEEGRNDEAADAVRKAIEINPSAFMAWGNLSSVLSRIPGKEQESREACEKAISLGEEFRKKAPSDPSLLGQVGLCYARNGNAAKSVPMLRQAVAFAPEDPEVLYLAAQGNEMLHQRKEALLLIGRALQNGLSMRAVERNPGMAALRANPEFANLSGQLIQKNK